MSTLIGILITVINKLLNVYSLKLQHVHNVNWLLDRKHEVDMLIKVHKLHILLISKEHVTSKSVFSPDGYYTYATCHSDGTTYAGICIIADNYKKEFKSPIISRI